MIRARRASIAAAALIVVSSLFGANADTVTYTYDALGRIATVTYSSGKIVTYTYDAAGNRTQVTQN